MLAARKTVAKAFFQNLIPPGWSFRLALEILSQLAIARKTSPQGLRMSDMADALHIEHRHAEQALNALHELKWIGKLEQSNPRLESAWVLLVDLQDGQTVESVLLPRQGVCVSTQLGCAVGCTFCMTGRDGLLREVEAHVGDGEPVGRRGKDGAGQPRALRDEDDGGAEAFAVERIVDGGEALGGIDRQLDA